MVLWGLTFESIWEYAVVQALHLVWLPLLFLHLCKIYLHLQILSLGVEDFWGSHISNARVLVFQTC